MAWVHCMVVFPASQLKAVNDGFALFDSSGSLTSFGDTEAVSVLALAPESAPTSHYYGSCSFTPAMFVDVENFLATIPGASIESYDPKVVLDKTGSMLAATGAKRRGTDV